MKNTGVPPMAEMPKEENIDVKTLIKDLIDKRINLICILGPTASGKTKYAVQLARQINDYLNQEDRHKHLNQEQSNNYLNQEESKTKKCHCEIISADSRQVYKGMDIGSGKDLYEYEEIPYHLIDVAPAGYVYSIYDYQKDFENAYKQIISRNNIAIICGGSGLYIEAATCGYKIAQVPPNYELRKKLESLPTIDLENKLRELRPQLEISFDSKKRLIRALELAIYEQENNIEYSNIIPKKCYFIGTLVDRDLRNKKIDLRLDKRLKEGIIEEVQGLINQGVSIDNLLHYGLEYKFITQYILKEISYKQMYEGLKVAIHQFAKRQMTWFRGMERDGIKIHWTKV